MTGDGERLATISGRERGSVLNVSVVPRASVTALEEAADGTLRVRVAAPPVEGAANAALLRFLADLLDIPRSRLSVDSGKSSRRKRIAIDGLTPAVLEERLRQAVVKGERAGKQR